MSVSKAGQVVSTMEQWFEFAPPKGGSRQWVDGRSAKELARAWLESDQNLPHEIAEALQSVASLGAPISWHAEAEAKLPFDELRGETRNSDLVVEARTVNGSILIAIEGKADESFGPTLRQATGTALLNFIKSHESRGLLRIQQLVQSVLGSRDEGRKEALQIRYQLLTATAGAMCEAQRRNCSAAVLLVHEFQTSRTEDELHQANTADLDGFVDWISNGCVNSVPTGKIVGPFTLPGAPLFSATLPFYIGKAVRSLR